MVPEKSEPNIDTMASQRKNKDFKQFWKSTNKLNVRPSLPETIAGCGNPTEIANMFKNHFGVASPLGPPSRGADAESNRLEDVLRFAAKQVTEIIRNMSRGKSPGHDCLSIEHLKFSGIDLPRVSAMFYSLCMSHSYIPNDMMRTVVPITKNKTGDISDKNNYRPLATIIAIIVKTPVLACPNFDYRFDIHTDASSYGIGWEHPVAYMSRSLTGPERNYSVREREALAVLSALEHWRCYIENGFTSNVFTDHAALKWFLSLSNPTGRLARWGVRLSSSNFTIKHRRGKDHVVPDALSRTVLLTSITLCDSSETDDDWYLNIYNRCIKSPSKFPNYTIKNNKLYRYMKSNNPLHSEFEWKLVVPKESRQQILTKNHSI
ncbi:jg12199 [Pararge aegeria aegeria]|uniref:Jg12199 protein n=1 Tax=Pararge aegeria aegeria TaxID=348720 RepID=A0A8S4SI05_9NEOP|nr:jg12199 [Pararge aegeria aegeria]